MTDPQVIVNLGTGGSDLNGQNGSTSSADSNDARFLDWPGDNAGNYVYLPGATGNYLSVPDEAALDITGDIDLRVQVALDDWTQSNVSLLGKLTTSGDQRAYWFRIQSDGTLRFEWSTDGTFGTLVNKVSTAAVPFSDGEAGWVRVTLDVDNGASGHDIEFFTSTDGSSWTQLGSTVTTAGTTSIYASTSPVQVGARGDNGNVGPAGKYYRAQVLDGIDGTTVLDIDTSVITSGSATSFTAATGQTVTINRSTSGRKSVAVVSPVWLFGTDDLITVSLDSRFQFTDTQDFTILAVLRQWNTPVVYGHYVATAELTANTAGYELGSQSTTLATRTELSDGTGSSIAVSGLVTEGSLLSYGVSVNRSTDQMIVYHNGSVSDTNDISSIGSSANDNALFIGRNAIGSLRYQDFELLGVAVFDRALTQSEHQQINTYYQSKVA